MTKKSLDLLKLVFGDNSPFQLPAAVAEQILEIRKWVAEELAKLPGENV